MDPITRLGRYIAMDRRQALSTGSVLSDRSRGTLLFADIAGFTPLTEALAATLGPRRGAEEITSLVNRVYEALVAEVHRYRGSVNCFIGDAVITFYEDDVGPRAVASALQMQRAMAAFDAVEIPGGETVSLGLKTSITSGPIRRFLVGDPKIRLIDVLAGKTLDRLADVEHAANPGEVLATADIVASLPSGLTAAPHGDGLVVIGGDPGEIPPAPWPSSWAKNLTAESLRPFLLRRAYDRILSDQGEFLAELRPVVSLFLHFEGIDYDDDQDAGEKLDRVAQWAQRVVARYSGHIPLITTGDKGSHLYAVFGALDAHEDDAQRAIAAALEIGEPPRELDFLENVRIGIASGRARVGAYGGTQRRAYGALGERVTVAARLMQAAPPGEIRCIGEIADACAERWSFEELGEISVKGVREPFAVFRPTGSAHRRTAEAHDAPLGRARERETLAELLAAVADGRRRVLLVEGEPGIGKSVLVGELLRISRAEGGRPLVGAADSMEQHTPYRAWREILEELFEIAEEPDAAARREIVARAVASLPPAYRGRLPLLDDILELGHVESEATRRLDPEMRRGGLTDLVAALLRSAAREAPLILVLEDAHWLDGLSWELAASLARDLADEAVLLVLTHRALEEPIPAPMSALSGMERVRRLRLEALPADEALAVAARRLGIDATSIPAEIAPLLDERAQGNPFYLQALVSTLRDRGWIEIRSGRCVISDDIETLRSGVPETIEGVVLSRLDRVSPGAQLTARVASVIGRSFLTRTLDHVYPQALEAGTLAGQLGELEQHRLTQLEASEPEERHAFEHAITQQVAYGTLLFEQRRGLHREVVRWYEEEYRDALAPYYPLLATHCRAAEELEAEARYCRLAGDQAAQRYANAEAARYYSRAIELHDGARGDGTLLRELLEARARTLALLGRVELERDDLERLQGLAADAGDPRAAASVLLGWSDFHRRAGSFQEAERAANEALAMVQDSEDGRLIARALGSLGSALEGQGKFEPARERVEEALTRHRALGDEEGEAVSEKTLGVIHARLGRFSVAMERFERAREVFRSIEDGKGEADILGNLGALEYYLGHYERSIAHTERARQLFTEMGFRVGSAKCLMNLGTCWCALGDFERGLARHNEAMALYGLLEDTNGFADCLSNLGIAHEALGAGGSPELTLDPVGENDHLTEAIESSEQARALYRQIGNARGTLTTQFNLGSAHLCLGDLDAAGDHLRAALETAREMQMQRLEMRCLSALARRARVAGDLKEAEALSGEALTLLEEQKIPEGDEVHFTHYRILLDVGRREEALPLLALARQSVVERSEAIEDDAVREGFLRAHGAILRAWEEENAATG
ncbi:MAG: tetratricopeptide repeat protein [Candidatus Bipolaricaulota bacterium]|nr:MAG: tetratricopeptide repeat protein [Candidatus Bipolaricaulota bacterium]